MDLKKLALCMALGSTAVTDALRPERRAFPFKTEITEAGSYAASEAGMDFVVSGSISGALAFSGDVPYRVTLSGASLAETLALSGDSILSVADNLTIGASSVIDFGRASDDPAPNARVPVATAGGTLTAPGRVKAVNTGDGRDFCHYHLAVEDGILYAYPTVDAMTIIIR